MRMFGFCVACLFAAASSLYAAIPTAAESKTAREKLAELTADDYKALKAKTKTNEQVGDALLGYADNEESVAGKFTLLQDAFQQYVLGKSVDKADSAYSKALAIGGVEYALEMARPARAKLSAYATSKNASAKALKERIAADEKSFQRVGIVKAKLKKAPGDESLCEQLGIEYAAIGDWESALAAFVTAAGEVAKIADWELNGGKGPDYTAATAGAFWWKFADNFAKRKNVEEAMKLHAAMWYKLAFDKDAFKGNEKAIVEKRIAETEKFGIGECQDAFALKQRMQNLASISVQLGKSNNRIEFVGCPAGEFDMGRPGDNGELSLTRFHKVKVTRPFWISRYQVTKRNYASFRAVANGDAMHEYYGGVDMPVCEVSVEDVECFATFVATKAKRNIPQGYVVRLPTEAEWEYALRANCQDMTDPYVAVINGSSDEYDKISVCSKDFEVIAKKNGLNQPNLWGGLFMKVGMKKPNAWGLFDMLGNGWELTLDTVDKNQWKSAWGDGSPHADIAGQIKYDSSETDPLRYSPLPAAAISRGAQTHCVVNPSLWTKHRTKTDRKGCKTTFRLCIGPDLIKEKGYDKMAQKKR